MDFQRFITQLKIMITNGLPGEESHQKMRVIYDKSIELPFSKINSTPAAVLILLYLAEILSMEIGYYHTVVMY